MSTVIFSKGRGQVAVFQDPSMPGIMSLRMDNWLGFQRFKAILTRVAISTQGNYQVLHSLGGDAFIYVFGDRVGQIIVSGLAFDSICGDPAGFLGIERVARYYNDNRLAVRQQPIKLTIGSSITLKMYLAAVSLDVEDVATKVWRFSFIMLQVPEPLKKLAGAPVAGGGAAPDEGDVADDGSGGGTSGGTGEPQDYPVFTAAGGSVDSGGYDPGLTHVPVQAGNGLETYGTGAVLSTQGFSL
jgi:hypothetical protein